MGCAKMKKLLCHGLAVAMVVSLTATASDSSAAAKKAKPAKKKPAGCSKFRNWSNNI